MLNNKSMPHLGSFVDKKIYETHNTRASVGKLIGKSHLTVYGYTKEPSLHSRILWDLSKALNFDFFEYLSNSLDLNGGLPKMVDEHSSVLSKQQYIAVLEEKIKDLQKELAIYKEIVLNKK